mgnify:FL=1
MNSIDILTKIYKPYKVSVKGNTKIFNCTSGNYVIKNKKNKDIKELYKYLNSRSFKYYPKLIEDNRDEVNVFEYVEDNSIDNEQKLIDLINLISLLHSKTSYYKEITNDKIKEIYEELLGRVEYLEEYLNKIIYEIEDNVFVSPSGNLILINSSKIFSSLTFLKNEIEEWYKISIDTNKMRVSIVHNNLELDHYIKNENEYLISWDNYIIDSPILDIVKLYKNVYLTMDFSNPLKVYMEKFPLNENEKKLLFIMLVMPDEINLTNNELKNISIVRKYLDYIYKTENLIRPYYSK